MEKIFENANEQHVRSITFFGHELENGVSILCYDPEGTKPVSIEDATRAYSIGAMLIATTSGNVGTFVPISTYQTGLGCTFLTITPNFDPEDDSAFVYVEWIATNSTIDEMESGAPA